MSDSPFERAGSLRVGHVDYVAPDEIRGKLDVESPESVALNTGSPRPFPRVNSYLLIRVEDTFLVGQAEWLTIELSPFPKRRGMRDFGVVDLPYPLRRIKLNPLGLLRKRYVENQEKELEGEYDFQRGSEALPSVGTTILLPTEKQLRAIIESGKNRRVKIGTSPLAGDAEVCVDPDRLFGRHLAVLGNTGSGKSCSVAGLIRWSLEAAGRDLGKTQPNARFIILDPNGEYSKAFKDDDGISARMFKVEPDKSKRESPLKVPLWFWNSEEWCGFARASAGVQRPTLLHALNTVRVNQAGSTNASNDSGLKIIQSMIDWLENWRSDLKTKETTKFYESLELWLKFLVNSRWAGVEEIIKKMTPLVQRHKGNSYAGQAFIFPEIEELKNTVKLFYTNLRGVDFDQLPIDVDAPSYFKGYDLLQEIRKASEDRNVSDKVDSLVVRIETLLRGVRIKPIIDDEGGEDGINLNDWLREYIGSNDVQETDSCVSIIDLSLVPTEIVHIITAVIARIVFESLQRYMKSSGETLPTVLVMEEAHTFVKRYREDIENQDAAQVCCQVFERIAREGRKFGLGLVISSQRPSEISPTVLSQCNTFLLHRISNDRDQRLVQELVPDNLRGLLRELPLLPSQRAILLGWASELPVLVKMRDLPPEHQPQSDDPDIWKVWTRKEERKLTWEEVANQWQNIIPADQPNQGGNSEAQQGDEGQERENDDGEVNNIEDEWDVDEQYPEEDDDDEEPEQNYTHPPF